MFHYLYLIAVFVASAYGQSNNRIVGGTPAIIQRYPHQVSLRDTLLNHFCGGSIVSNRAILTAAHCLRGRPAAVITVVAGSTFLTPAIVTRTVRRILIHPLYNPNTMNWDAALLTLSADLNFGPTIQTIPLAATEPAADTNALTIGWGATSEGGQGSNQLRVVVVPIVARAVCVGNYAPIGITPIMICAGATGKDSCQGDAGGPLVVNRQLVGIVSWGEGCGRPNKPGVYTNAARLRPWVAANV